MGLGEEIRGIVKDYKVLEDFAEKYPDLVRVVRGQFKGSEGSEPKRLKVAGWISNLGFTYEETWTLVYKATGMELSEWDELLGELDKEDSR